MARSKPVKQQEQKQQTQEPGLPLEWLIPDCVPTHRVTNAVIETFGDEFVLSFFEHRGPIITDAHALEKAKELKAVKTLCVARICITPEKMARFIKAFSQQYDQYMESKKKNALGADGLKK